MLPRSIARHQTGVLPFGRRPSIDGLWTEGIAACLRTETFPVNQISRRLVDSGLASALDEKNNNFLPSSIGLDILIFRKTASAARASHVRRARTVSASKTESDSEMAPQAIEIAKNGLGNASRRLNVS
jgi:hypothetical protein